ncbi:DNA repair ATPase [Streptomyces sp. NPDC058045]|uniref:DNA repair ATPase n=1 Tax=Streptomyces sp. NPDC058045 TaxID=3346311 RepID=UPI0036E957A7
MVATPAAPESSAAPGAVDTAAPAAAPDLGTYEVLRDRLAGQAAELARRAEALDARRVEEFGSTRLALAATEQLATTTPSVARSVTALGEVLLAGYEPRTADGASPKVAEVFVLHDRELAPLPEDTVPGLLDDPAFRREFAELFRYFRGARLLELRQSEGRLLAVFRTGESAEDLRVLRWSCPVDGPVRFLDARGDRDRVTPPPHDVEWLEATREDQRLGRHPHLRVTDGVFVSTVGGALTVKTEDDTETPDGIHSEPVDEPLQALADAEVAHASVGPLVLLRVRPYKEERARYLVVDTVRATVTRMDGIGQGCRRLPDGQGVVFPGGCHLTTGGPRTFDTDTTGLGYDRTVTSPNGEDLLYVFHAAAEGRTLLQPYNTIRRQAAAPLVCHGYALHEDGTLLVLRGGGEPGRVHPVQRWTSPFTSDTWAASRPAGQGPLARIGNADLVRALSDCLAVARAVESATAGGPSAATAAGYAELDSECTRALDAHHWLGDDTVGDLRGPLEQVRDTARQTVAEFETVRALTRRAAESVAASESEIASLVRRVRGEAPASAGEWVDRLSALREAGGRLLTLKDLRYADTDRIDALAASLDQDTADAGRRAVGFLAGADAFDAPHEEVARLAEQAAAAETVADTGPLAARLDELTAQLGTVAEVVTGLDTGDATVRTGILERIAEVLGGVNRARAVLDARRGELSGSEGRAEFAAETSLLGQAVTGALAGAGTPEQCDEQLALLLVRLENLQARFSESDALLAELDERREEIHEAFASRKQTLLDARARQADRLARSADRVLATVGRRVRRLASAEEIGTFFASDPLTARIRATCAELAELGEPARAAELAGRLDAARQEAARSVRDRGELYAADGSVRLGRHQFAVNTQPLDLTLVPGPDGEAPCFALTGTDYRAPVTGEEFATTRAYWEQTLPSETAEVYRAEHLAAKLLAEHGADRLADEDLDLSALVRRAAEEAYDEGYQRGVHDRDAELLLRALVRLHAAAGLLRFSARDRAAAQLLWAHGEIPRDALARRARSLAGARAAFGAAGGIEELRGELASHIGEFVSGRLPGPLWADTDPDSAAHYLFEELALKQEGFAAGAAARELLRDYRASVGEGGYAQELAGLESLAEQAQLVESWLAAGAAANGTPASADDLAEAVATELAPELTRYAVDAPLTEEVTGLLGTHPRISGGTLTVRLDEFLARTRRHRTRVLPGFRDYQKLRSRLITAERERIGLDALRPSVHAGFVRNRLVDEVYLPLVGDSLAAQFGTAGGLLLLVSPPGYGKTTLMEYVADRLGLVLVKVDGPALGNRTTSLDPATAPDAAARRELERVNFAFEAGGNVLLYLDDIQHTSPELLQRFIPLCDGQRRIDGVWEGRPRRYDLRGKRFAVCMAGNPYTEDQGRFKIPDMLANRAAVWDLGEVLGSKQDAFALSFVENALTAHPVLAPLAGRERADLELLLRIAREEPGARADRLAVPLDGAELTRTTRTLRHLLAARDTVLRVNSAYIASAGQSDGARTEPPFLLQGSYRDLNRIAARIDPVMEEAELDALIRDHYTAEARTLTSGAEANLLKLAELCGTLTPAQAARWDELRAAHVRVRDLGGDEQDPLARAVGALGLLADRVAAVERAIDRAAGPHHPHDRSQPRHANRP